MNKTAFYWTRNLTRIAVIAILVMVVRAAYESWSGHHGTPEEPWLYTTLICIFGIFLIRALTHPEKDTDLFLLNMFWIKWVRNRNLNLTVAALFACVLIFGVNSLTPWVRTAHMIATGSAIAAVYLNMVFYFDTKVGRGLTMLGAIIGIGGFITSLPQIQAMIQTTHSISEGEMIAAAPVIAWIYLTTKLKK